MRLRCLWPVDQPRIVRLILIRQFTFLHSSRFVPNRVQGLNDTILESSRKIDMEAPKMKKSVVWQRVDIDFLAIGNQAADVPVSINIRALCWTRILVSILALFQGAYRLAEIENYTIGHKAI